LQENLLIFFVILLIWMIPTLVVNIQGLSQKTISIPRLPEKTRKIVVIFKLSHSQKTAITR